MEAVEELKTSLEKSKIALTLAEQQTPLIHQVVE